MIYKNKASVKEGFFSGVLVLSVSTVIVKIIGLAYKIPMLSLLGAEGMGYFNSAYEIYAVLCVISTAGLPVALSMLIASYKEAKEYGMIRSVYRSALSIFLFLGIVGSIVMAVLSPTITTLIDNSNALYCIVAISPSIFFVCLSSAIRGYFQGYGNMVPTAISQLIEAVGKLVFGVIFASVAIKKGYTQPTVAAYAVLGLSLGMLLSSAYLIVKKLFCKEACETCKDIPQKGVFGVLIRIALPITLSSAVLGITRLADMSLIMNRLQKIGYSESIANEIYGAYSTIALPIFGLLPALVTPISLSLIPVLSAAIERRDRTEETEVSESALRLTAIFSIPSSLAIVIYSSPIISLLFGKAGEGIDNIASLLSMLAISIPFACIITTTNAILQAYRKTVVPIVSMTIGALIKVLLAYVLISIPKINVYGAPISTFFCDATITVINIAMIYRVNRGKCNFFSVFIKPVISSAIAMLVSAALYVALLKFTLSDKLSFILSATVAVVAYFVMALMTKTITDGDLRMIPILNKITIKKKKSRS